MGDSPPCAPAGVRSLSCGAPGAGGRGPLVIEQAPVPRGDPGLRGVVAGGPVGSRGAGRSAALRYEIRRWRDGVIPDIAEAVDSPRLLTTDPAVAQRVLDLVAAVPTPVWGRDELGAGEMWNSNSIMAWVITRAGLDAEAIHPPARGRAPAGRRRHHRLPPARVRAPTRGRGDRWESRRARERARAERAFSLGACAHRTGQKEAMT